MSRDHLDTLLKIVVSDLSDEDAIAHLSELNNLAFDYSEDAALEKSIALATQIDRRDLHPHPRANLDYIVGTAWGNLRSLRVARSSPWDWESQELFRSMLHLRRACQGSNLNPNLLVMAYTNLANELNVVGRAIDALRFYELALDTKPGFPMALGNRALSSNAYLRCQYENAATPFFLRSMHSDLTTALQDNALHDDAIASFTRLKVKIEEFVPGDFFEHDLDYGASLNDQGPEGSYRTWCLHLRLFLNPLNDLGPFPIAAEDRLHAPSMVTPIDQGPQWFGLFNQLKQEYVSARFLLYEGLHQNKPHYSDSKVSLFNTLDYPVYGLAIEKVRTAFRLAYSLLDKVAFFLNDYFNLRISEYSVSFRSLWYRREHDGKLARPLSLRPEFEGLENNPFRGLFWLAKDLYEKNPEFQEAMFPDARAVNEIRNQLEHKYLKVHDALWNGDKTSEHARRAGSIDDLAHSVYRSNFESMAIELLKLARAAIIYLSNGIGIREKQLTQGADKGALPELPMTHFDDEWKV